MVYSVADMRFFWYNEGMSKRIHGLVLAAGLSTRMGSPKQLLPFGNRTVLQTVVDTLLCSELDGVLVVLGHRVEDIRKSLQGRSVETCVNDKYEEGMFTSVLCGMEALEGRSEGVLIALGDQPQILESEVRRVVEAYRAGNRGIVIPTSKGKRRHPALIDITRYLAEMRSLSGTEGLKPIMRGHPEDTLEVPIPQDRILRDMDTPEDYQSELDRLGYSE